MRSLLEAAKHLGSGVLQRLELASPTVWPRRSLPSGPPEARPPVPRLDLGGRGG
jgi:hypothetical protein